MKKQSKGLTETDVARFESCMKDLSIAFVGEITEQKILLYYKMLSDKSIEVIEEAVKEMLNTRKERFFPTIAEIRAEIEYLEEYGW